jgi:hypothetical protein
MIHERFRFIEGILYWLQFIRFFRGPFNVQMLHIPALTTIDNIIQLDSELEETQMQIEPHDDNHDNQSEATHHATVRLYSNSYPGLRSVRF